jgi:hypothetical protein
VKSTTSQGSRQSRSAITWLPCSTCFGCGSHHTHRGRVNRRPDFRRCGSGCTSAYSRPLPGTVCRDQSPSYLEDRNCDDVPLTEPSVASEKYRRGLSEDTIERVVRRKPGLSLVDYFVQTKEGPDSMHCQPAPKKMHNEALVRLTVQKPACGRLFPRSRPAVTARHANLT